jgi:hypothetical protein
MRAALKRDFDEAGSVTAGGLNRSRGGDFRRQTWTQESLRRLVNRERHPGRTTVS